MCRRRFRTLAMLALLGAWGMARAADPQADYDGTVKPLLKGRCYACHGALKQKAGLRLDTAEAIRAGGESGPAVEPGRAEDSLLLERLTEADPALRMPPEGPPLTADQIRGIRAWIDAGAAAPPGVSPEADPRDHWAFRPPVRPAVPAVAGARNPIDAFLAADHRRRGLLALPEAGPHARLRRVFLDLIGLPPSRDDLLAFAADPSDAHYERIVDRLLADPRHGERWARHWMDVWRYSDWYGRRSVPDVLNSYASIWRWRDWIVGALNEDRPYDAMVRAMLAADELTPGDAVEMPATGFLLRNFYRWNYNAWMKDNVEHTAKAFLGLTVSCAHCHDHKYDPITRRDYFALRAAFEPLEVRHDRVPGEADPGVYPKYDYGKAYPPIKSGLARVYDEDLAAQTFEYDRGESRNVRPGSAPVPPGPPAFLAGPDYRVETVRLPAEVAYPGLKESIRDEEIRKADAALIEADASRARARDAADAAERSWARALADSGGPTVFLDDDPPVPAFAGDGALEAARTALVPPRLALLAEEAGLTDANARRGSLLARIAADRRRFGQSDGDAEAAARLAAAAGREAEIRAATLDLARAELALFDAREAGGVGADKKAIDAAAKAAQAKDAAARRLADLEATTADPKAPAVYRAITPIYPEFSTGRRAALARWITGRGNPLAARVAVNHLWRWHVGTPLVATTADFGRNGKAPTHPELLDWLAVELMEPSAPGAAPWSMKALHRTIVTSDAYRRASHAADPPHASRSIDPENRHLWKFPTTRMEAEVVRDALLHVGGLLDPTPGGPDIDFAQGLVSKRRSLYFTHHGEARMPFLETFDAPDACDAYTRGVSVVPQQALALVNNDLLIDAARRAADRLAADLGPESDDDGRFLVAAFERVLSRPPTGPERDAASAFLRLGESARARRNLVHALFSHNDFVTIR